MLQVTGDELALMIGPNIVPQETARRVTSHVLHRFCESVRSGLVPINGELALDSWEGENDQEYYLRGTDLPFTLSLQAVTGDIRLYLHLILSCCYDPRDLVPIPELPLEIHPIIMSQEESGLGVTLMSSAELVFERFTAMSIIVRLRVSRWLERGSYPNRRKLILYACMPFDSEIDETREVQIFMGRRCLIDPHIYFATHAHELIVGEVEYSGRWIAPARPRNQVDMRGHRDLLRNQLWFLTHQERLPIMMSLEGSFRDQRPLLTIP